MSTDGATGALAAPEPDRAAGAGAARDTRVSRLDNLGPRIVSALILMPIGIGAALAGGPWLAAATAGAVVIMSYEWARMSEPGATNTAFAFCAIAGVAAVLAASWAKPMEGLAACAAVAAVSALRRRTWAERFDTAGGAFYVAAPCVCFLWMRGHGADGALLILSLFGIIWSADVAAYFCGQLIGGPKIAPQFSPAKTWSGIIGGTLAGVMTGAVIGSILAGPLWLWASVGGVMAFIGLCGDLFESMLKRRFGVKDASGFLPGHGGFLDRLDGLMAASVAAALALWAYPGGLGLLFGSA
jgi:phosphatidate cytidylyltransferase